MAIIVRATLLERTTIGDPSLSQMWTCRALYNSANLVKTSCRASCTRLSGSFSTLSRPTFT
jgi:hypothetical protein